MKYVYEIHGFRWCPRCSVGVVARPGDRCEDCGTVLLPQGTEVLQGPSDLGTGAANPDAIIIG